MTITAKFAGTCAACGNRILVGQLINWARGTKASHKTCASVVAPKAAPVKDVQLEQEETRAALRLGFENLTDAQLGEAEANFERQIKGMQACPPTLDILNERLTWEKEMKDLLWAVQAVREILDQRATAAIQAAERAEDERVAAFKMARDEAFVNRNVTAGPRGYVAWG